MNKNGMISSNEEVASWIRLRRQYVVELADLCERLLLEKSELEAINVAMEEQVVGLLAKNEELERSLELNEKNNALSKLKTQRERFVAVSTAKDTCQQMLENVSNSIQLAGPSSATVIITNQRLKLPNLPEAENCKQSTLISPAWESETMQITKTEQDVNDVALLEESEPSPSDRTSYVVRTRRLNVFTPSFSVRKRSSDRQQFQCKRCGQQYQSRSSFSEHRRKSDCFQGTEFSCRFCGRTFSVVQHRVQHEYIHTGERPYFCPTCGKSFTQPGSQQRHSKRCPNKIQAANLESEQVESKALI